MIKKIPFAMAACMCATQAATAADPLWISQPATNIATSSLTLDAVPALVSKRAAIPGIQAMLVAPEHLRMLAQRSTHAHGPGFIVHGAFDDIALAESPTSYPGYEIDQHNIVQHLSAQIQEPRMAQVINQLTQLRTRRHDSDGGARAPGIIAELWRGWSAHRTDVEVKLVSHVRTPQKSVELTIKGSERPDEFIVLGGHLDSDAKGPVAPGADDNASGIASLSEALHVLLENDFRPRRSLKFIAYAAEEFGLVGSGEIAANHRESNIDVLGVMQLDMTNYKGSNEEIWIYEDFTDSRQNDFLRQLLTIYQPQLRVAASRCGYGCSDHESWTRYGYPASFPHEARMDQSNPYIHSAQDTIERSGSGTVHAAHFARLAVAYAVELGNHTTRTGR
ncbi:M20/M25/M40 family metallo-hydrolase [Dyella sp.]|uniref:M20/M25/M40 family metallo-hydrolase n=1 Tax=Dyella sp. TaxID=1869338 RepID=UPI002ECFF5EB